MQIMIYLIGIKISFSELMLKNILIFIKHFCITKIYVKWIHRDSKVASFQAKIDENFANYIKTKTIQAWLKIIKGI